MNDKTLLNDLYNCQKQNQYLACIPDICDKITIGHNQPFPDVRENYGSYLHINLKGGPAKPKRNCCDTITRSVEFCAGACSPWAKELGLYFSQSDNAEHPCEIKDGALVKISEILYAVWLDYKRKECEDDCSDLPALTRVGDWRFNDKMGQRCDTYSIEHQPDCKSVEEFKIYLNQGD